MKPRKRARVLWWLLYAALCGLEFVVHKAKEAVAERIWPKPEPPPKGAQ